MAETLAGHDKDEERGMTDFVVGDFIVVGTQLCMDTRRIDDFHPVPIVAFCFLRGDGSSDIRLYARKHLDDT